MNRCPELVCAAAFCAATLCAATAGFTNNPPFTYPGPGGAPSGFAVEVLNEAARREGIHLDWRLIEPSASPPGPGSGIDLWPAGVSTEERRRSLHITRPWWRTELIVVTRPGVESLERLAGKRAAATRDLETVVRGSIPQAAVVPAASHSAAAVSLCRNSVDAFVTDRIILDQLLLNRPAECAGVPLRLLSLPGATLDLAILAVPAQREVAERLRDRIDSMQAGGVVGKIALEYPAIPAASAPYLTSIMQTEHRQDLLRVVLILVTILLGVSGALVFTLYRDVRRRQRTERELRETNSDLQQFSYAASHDLSEPIRNMVLYSEVLERRYGDRLDGEGRRFLAVIQQGGTRMQRLLESLREYTELSREPNPPGETDVREVVEQALAGLRERIEQTGAVVTYDALPTIRFPESRLLQVFQNLISNALKYRGEGPPRIHIGARKEGHGWTFCVADDGVGIAPEYREKIFDVFKRLHSPDVAGAGLGLAICKRIVERDGGRIWVESKRGEGAKFYFTIRAAASGNPSSGAARA